MLQLMYSQRVQKRAELVSGSLPVSFQQTWSTRHEGSDHRNLALGSSRGGFSAALQNVGYLTFSTLCHHRNGVPECTTLLLNSSEMLFSLK
jgi:hypothetical protein